MSKSRAIIRLLWGESLEDPKYKTLTEKTINCVLNDKYQAPFITYVFGENNYKFLREKGLRHSLVLAGKDPKPRKDPREKYFHRFDLCDIALHDFDEIICINWDMRLVREYDEEQVWTSLNKKSVIQAPLAGSSRRARMAKELKVPLRGSPQGYISVRDGFLYFRDKTIPKDILKMNNYPEIVHIWNTETLVSSYIDKVNGKWIGKSEYFNRHEPECVLAGAGTLYRKWKINNKSFYFAFRFRHPSSKNTPDFYRLHENVFKTPEISNRDSLLL